MPPAEPLPPWRALLRGAREREGRSPAARWLQLATMAADGTPRVRTLVFRGWAGPSQLDLLTDGRSGKAAELEHQPAVELCWLLPKARCQFRLRGLRQTLPADLDHNERQRHWDALSAPARALWVWPEPGAPLDRHSSFAKEVADGTPLPETVVLLRFGIERVELLELGTHPHRRRRWRHDAEWAEELLNP